MEMDISVVEEDLVEMVDVEIMEVEEEVEEGMEEMEDRTMAVEEDMDLELMVVFMVVVEEDSILQV